MTIPTSSTRPVGEETLGLQSSLPALEESSEFRGPVEPMDGHHCNDHFALLYESQEEQLDAAVPFVRQGIENDERCIYVVDDESEIPPIRDAMVDAGIDVDAAVGTGQFSFELVEDTYLRNGTFVPDEMIDFYGQAIDTATEEWSALRITAQTSWLEQEETSIEDFMAYEAKVNELFEGRDCIALCQYDRTAFDPDVVRDIVQTHPHLIYEGTVCHNFYHTPPSEYFGPDSPSREVDRMLGTLVDRTEAKAELQGRKEFLREQNEIISSPDRTFEDKLRDLFELGRERFDLDLGGMARVDRENDRCTVEHVSGEHEFVEAGASLPLSEAFCGIAVRTNGVVSVGNAVEAGYESLTACRDFGINAYLGTQVDVQGAQDRTFFFLDADAQDQAFTDDQQTFVQLMAQWVKYEFEHNHRERRLEEAVDRLERSNDRLEQFAHAASHDLQEPLRMVSSYLQLVETRADEELSEETEEFLEFAVDGADRMREMIQGLLQYSRVETRGQEPEPIDLDRVVGEALSDLSLMLDDGDASVAVGPLDTVEGDGNQLRQVVQNLLSNAVKYGGEEPSVDVAAERVEDEVVLTVTDDGPGIPEDEADRIFDVFERLHGREEQDGTGIGLALCERIVERHGGDIWVDSAPGEGSTFHVTLPAAN